MSRSTLRIVLEGAQNQISDCVQFAIAPLLLLHLTIAGSGQSPLELELLLGLLEQVRIVQQLLDLIELVLVVQLVDLLDQINF